ncbi:type II toxin-antitoxin system RelE/ParE family toxin [Specibacter cremeus]|uniref:type II toxin-antitoxin system RelE/ParE family toxin n=1 Tax=Specibacter cremeus TaxID=1629051 RepID=UPI000F78237B|nr:type II toxin-antitoxin system RelE/ParE family toxin [Specibacter cremeus]
MDLSFSSNKLERQLTEDKVMRKTYSDQWVKKLRLRMKELQAAENMAELQEGPGHWHPLVGNLAPQWAGEVSGNFRIFVTPLGNGAAAEITAVQIEKIDDYH